MLFHFQGTLSDSENVLKGKVEIPNLSEEHEPEDVDVSCLLYCQSIEAGSL